MTIHVDTLLALADKWNNEGFAAIDTAPSTIPHAEVVEALVKRKCARELEMMVIEHLRAKAGVDNRPVET